MRQNPPLLIEVMLNYKKHIATLSHLKKDSLKSSLQYPGGKVGKRGNGTVPRLAQDPGESYITLRWCA